MRIGIVAPFVQTVRGGVERHAADLADALRARGHTVDLAASASAVRTSGTDWVLFEGIDRRALLGWSRRAGPGGPKMGVFTHGTFLPVIHAAELRARGWTGGAGELPRRLFDRAWMGRCLGAADLLFALSRSEQRDLAQLFPRLAARVLAVPNIVAPEDSEPAPEPRGGRTPYVTAISRIDPRKNLAMIPEALAGTDIGFRLAGQDQGDLARVRRAARKAGYGGFEYLGPIEPGAARQLIRGAIATVLPSFFEGVPYLALQSLAQGVPCLCTDLSYLDPVGGLSLLRPEPENWGRALRAWERGGRPATSRPPGLAEWDPLFRQLEEGAGAHPN